MDSKTKKKRCPNGTRRNNKTGNCDPIKVAEKAKTDEKTEPKDQVEHFNLFQNDFVLTMMMRGKSIKMKNKDNNICAEITIKSNTHLYLDNLYKCGTFSGTNVIQAVETFAKKYGYKTIELEDDARIESKFTQFRKNGGHCSIWVPVLQILATGETWYNKLGYKSKFYAQEVAHNKKIIETPFIKLITDIALETDYSRNRDRRSPTLEELIGGRSHVMEGTDLSVTVREVFTNVVKNLKIKEFQCDEGHPDIEWILDILDFLVTWGGVVQSSVKRANPKNIIYLRNGEMITQTKIL